MASLPNEFEIGVGVGEGILHEILFKIRISLLIVSHRRISKVVEIHVFDPICERIRKPAVDKPRSGLDNLRIRTSEGYEMSGGIAPVVQYGQTGDDFTFVTRDVASYVVRRDGGHRAVVFDVILLIKVFYGRISKRLHEFEVGDGINRSPRSEKLLSRTPRSFVPLFLVLRGVDYRESRLGKMGPEPHASPSLRYDFPAGRYPNHETRTETLRFQFGNVRLFFETLELRDIEKLSNAFQPSES